MPKGYDDSSSSSDKGNDEDAGEKEGDDSESIDKVPAHANSDDDPVHLCEEGSDDGETIDKAPAHSNGDVSVHLSDEGREEVKFDDLVADLFWDYPYSDSDNSAAAAPAAESPKKPPALDVGERPVKKSRKV